MDAYSARIHLKHDLASAASVAHAMRDDILDTRSLVLDVLSVDRRHRHVMNEKCDVLATLTIPKRVARIRELIALAREMQAASQS